MADPEKARLANDLVLSLHEDAAGTLYRCGTVAANELDKWINRNPVTCKITGKDREKARDEAVKASDRAQRAVLDRREVA